MSLIVDEHRQYLSDIPRISAFERAIAEVVEPADVVLDLGSGTGILGLLSCRAGAKRVYSIDSGDMIELARGVCRANGFQDRVVFLRNFSLHVDLPEKVDVVVADQIGRFGFEAGVLEYFPDARARFLKPDGRLIPNRISLWIAPVEAADLGAQIEFWNGEPAGFDFRSARSWAANTGYPARYRPEQLLGEPAVGAVLDLAHVRPEPFTAAASIVVTREGTLHGIGGWFSADLSPSVTMTNSPVAGDSINRQNVFFPIDRPLPVLPGDRVDVEMKIMPVDVMVTWKVSVSGSEGPKASFTHSTWKGMLVSRETLRRTRPTFAPKLSPRGVARATVLSLCDGERPLAEIEREVYDRHGDLFRSLADAAVFVAEVVTRYSV